MPAALCALIPSPPNTPPTGHIELGSPGEGDVCFLCEGRVQPHGGKVPILYHLGDDGRRTVCLGVCGGCLLDLEAAIDRALLAYSARLGGDVHAFVRRRDSEALASADAAAEAIGILGEMLTSGITMKRAEFDTYTRAAGLAGA